MEHAEGDWITFLDADDRIDNNHLQLYVDKLEELKGDCDVLMGGFFFVKGDSVSRETACEASNIIELTKNSRVSLAGLWNKIFRREVIGKERFTIGYTVSEDYHFVLRVLQQVSKIATIPMTGYRYIWWDKGNATSKYHACREEVQRECDRLLTNLYVKAGMFPEEARTILLREKYIETYFGVINLYKEGCLMDFWQKKKKIRQLVFEDADMPEAYQFYPWHRQHLYVRFMTLGYLLRSPFFIALTYQCLFWIKRRIR